MPRRNSPGHRSRDTAFAAINDGDPGPMIESLSPKFVYRFHGDHALGGTRRIVEGMSRWWERVMRLLPGARFDIEEIIARGWPWGTRVALRAHVAGELPGGEKYENTMFQFMSLRWGRVTSIETLEDLHVLEGALARLAATGCDEAAAAPIRDRSMDAAAE
ncbi:nuclear transport factor 2 family protein [Microbacterium sp. NPDC090003]|uniref:nuclear transport factor 2 family protein n=1 Tax=Microbacterium sp. NPDC090003 TaxID=3364203 RepID=UPI003815DEAF